MAGYLLHSLSNEVFQQLITSPTREQALVLADYMLGDVMPYSDEFEFFEEAEIWPEDRDALADRIMVMYAGRVAGIVGPETTRDELGLLMAGAVTA